MSNHFLVKIVNGELDFGSDFNLVRFNEFKKLNEGKILRIQQDRPIRSLSQNALMWVYLAKVELETGNESADLHELFKSLFLPKRLIKINGKSGVHEVETIGSTTKLKKHEFSEYLDKCSAYCGIPLPTIEEIKALGYIQN